MKTVPTTTRMRISTASMPRFSARPPHTPVRTRSLRLRRRAGFCGRYCGGGAYGGGGPYDEPVPLSDCVPVPGFSGAPVAAPVGSTGSAMVGWFSVMAPRSTRMPCCGIGEHP